MCNICIDKVNEDLSVLLVEYKENPNLLTYIAIEQRVKLLAKRMLFVFISDTYLDTNLIDLVNMNLANCVIEMLQVFKSDTIDINKDLKNDLNYMIFEFTD